MVNKVKCYTIIVATFAVLEIIVAMIFIGIGASRLSELDNDENPLVNLLEKVHSEMKIVLEDDVNHWYGNTVVQTKTALRTTAIILIIAGVICIIDGIIAIVGCLKANRILLIVHAVIVALNVIESIINICNSFSPQNFGGVLICAARFGLVIILIQYLKQEETEQSATMVPPPPYKECTTTSV